MVANMNFSNLSISNFRLIMYLYEDKIKEAFNQFGIIIEKEGHLSRELCLSIKFFHKNLLQFI
jgi:hypothetical protein